MPRKKLEISFIRKIQQIKKAGITRDRALNSTQVLDELDSLDARIRRMFDLLKNHSHKAVDVIFFVMYDIEDHKVRKEIAKYLEKKGCQRIQKSIFIAEMHRNMFKEIHETLKEVNSLYENNDSIILVPVTTNEVQGMKIIGQQIDMDMILGNQNTLFF